MASIGSFTVAAKAAREEVDGKPPEPDTFNFQGEEFRLTDDDTPPMVPLMELADAYQSTDENELSMPALAATWQMLKFCIHRDDWARFRRTAMDARAGIDDLMPVTMAAWEAVTGRPSRGPSDSSDGPQANGTRSKDASASTTGLRSSGEVPDLTDKLAANEWQADVPAPKKVAKRALGKAAAGSSTGRSRRS